MRSLAVSLLTLLLLSSAASAAEEGPEKIFDFASGLYSSGNYYGAVLEYQRLLSYYPSSSLTEEASFMVGASYFDAGKNEDAAKSFAAFLSSFPESARAGDALERIARSEYRGGAFTGGILKMSAYKDRFRSGTLFDEVDYLTGWGYLGQYDYSNAESVFYYLAQRDGPYKERSAGLSADVKGGAALPSRSPFLAGLMSAILPGSGHVYAEKYYDGLTSFALNAAFIYLAAEGYRTGNNSTGIFFSVIEIGWYSGGIYGGVRSAEKYNEEHAEDFVNGLKVKYQFDF